MTEPKASIAALAAADERSAEIARLVDRSAPGVFVPYRGAYAELPVARVPADLLAYRLDNGRIFFELEPALRELGLDRNSARREADGARVQGLLHRLLAEKARDRRGAILAELSRHGQQTEPLLITADGVVVNGNRRLAAMRELFAQDPGQFAGFATVAAAVLPRDANAADLEYIEAALQMAPEVKLAYAWVNRRLKLRWQRGALNLPFAEIADAYRLADQDQLARELAELTLAEDYLRHFGEEDRYDLVQDAEAFFTGLNGVLAGLQPPSLRDLWRLAGFTMIRARAQLEKGAAQEFPFAAPNPADLPVTALRGFAAEQGILPEAEGATFLPGAPATEAMRALLSDPEGMEERAAALSTTIHALRAQHRERAAPQRVLRRLREARGMLERLEASSFSREQQRRLRGELAALHQQATDLLTTHEDPIAAPLPPAPMATFRETVDRMLRRWSKSTRRERRKA